jgi:hypothetical protein
VKPIVKYEVVMRRKRCCVEERREEERRKNRRGMVFKSKFSLGTLNFLAALAARDLEDWSLAAHG